MTLDERIDATTKRAIDRYGVESQIDQVIEEAAEIIVAIRHFNRGRVKFESVLSEMADLYQLLHQFRGEFPTAFSKALDASLTKLERRLDEGCEP